MMLTKKTAQSALEFLTTYGWAFLVILIMVGALSYFGVLDPSRFLPEKCQLTTGFSCQETSINAIDDYFQIRITQNIGRTIEILTYPDAGTAIPIMIERSAGADCSAVSTIEFNDQSMISGTGTISWPAGQDATLEIVCQDVPDDTPVTLDFAFQYREVGSTFDQLVRGTVAGRSK